MCSRLPDVPWRPFHERHLGPVTVADASDSVSDPSLATQAAPAPAEEKRHNYHRE